MYMQLSSQTKMNIDYVIEKACHLLKTRPDGALFRICSIGWVVIADLDLLELLKVLVIAAELSTSRMCHDLKIIVRVYR